MSSSLSLRTEGQSPLMDSVQEPQAVTSPLPAPVAPPQATHSLENKDVKEVTLEEIKETIRGNVKQMEADRKKLLMQIALITAITAIIGVGVITGGIGSVAILGLASAKGIIPALQAVGILTGAILIGVPGAGLTYMKLNQVCGEPKEKLKRLEPPLKRWQDMNAFYHNPDYQTLIMNNLKNKHIEEISLDNLDVLMQIPKAIQSRPDTSPPREEEIKKIRDENETYKKEIETWGSQLRSYLTEESIAKWYTPKDDSGYRNPVYSITGPYVNFFREFIRVLDKNNMTYLEELRKYFESHKESSLISMRNKSHHYLHVINALFQPETLSTINAPLLSEIQDIVDKIDRRQEMIRSNIHEIDQLEKEIALLR